MKGSVKPLRVLLDLNIWIASLIAASKGRRDTAAQQLVAIAARGVWGREGRAVQLVVSLEMLETLETVLKRRGTRPGAAEAYANAVMNIMKSGPEELDPYLLFGGREQFATADIEDAGVLATAYASRADILVTDNLRDFRTKESTSINTQAVRTRSGFRQLQALRHRRGDVDLIVAHPFDVVEWLRRGYDFRPGKLWEAIRESAADHTSGV